MNDDRWRRIAAKINKDARDPLINRPRCKPNWVHFLVAEDKEGAFVSTKLTACGAEFKSGRREVTKEENRVTCPRCLTELGHRSKSDE